MHQIKITAKVTETVKGTEGSPLSFKARTMMEESSKTWASDFFRN